MPHDHAPRRQLRRSLRQRVPARSDAPDDRLPAAGHAAGRRDAAARRGARARRDPDAQPRDVRDDVDGARGAAGHRRQPAPQLHRPRRVPADGRDRAALHPHARRPLPRAGRDDRHAHAGLLGGDHARRAVAEVEVARAPREGRARRPTARTSSSAATCTSCGRSSAATSTSSRGSSRCSPTSSRSGPRTSSRTSTRTRSASRRSSGRRSPATPTTSSGINDAARPPARGARPRRAAAHRRRQRRLRVAVPVPGLAVGLPARAACARSTSPGHKYGLVYPGLGWLVFREPARPARGPRLLRELPRQARRDVHAELLHRLGHGAGPVLQLRPLRARGLPLHHGDDAGQRPRPGRAHRRPSASSSSSATRTPSSSRSWPSGSPGTATTTSSTSPRSSPPSAAGWCPPTRCRRTPST